MLTSSGDSRIPELMYMTLHGDADPACLETGATANLHFQCEICDCAAILR